MGRPDEEAMALRFFYLHNNLNISLTNVFRLVYNDYREVQPGTKTGLLVATNPYRIRRNRLRSLRSRSSC